MERYNTYSDHLKKKYGEKVYKIPISLPVKRAVHILRLHRCGL